MTNTRSKKLVEPKKTPKKTPIPRPNGRGALLVGGNYGNKGGGRRPEEVEQLATTLSYEEMIPKMRSLVNDPTSQPRTVIAAASQILGLVPKKADNSVPLDHVRLLCQSYSQQVMQIVAEIVPDSFLVIQARVEDTLNQIGV